MRPSRQLGHALLFTSAMCATAVPSAADEVGSDGEPNSANLTARVQALLPQVAALRGLEFKSEVSAEIVSDAEVRNYLTARIEKFDRAGDLDATERLYKLLGLVDADVDLLALLYDAIEEQVGGFYDPESGNFYILDDVPPSTLEAIAVHELTHALDDQHYELDQRLEAVQSSSDRSFVASAIHEGTAMLVMMRHAIELAARGEAVDPAAAGAALPQEALAKLPPVMLRQLIGPYVLGWTFLVRGDMTVLADGVPAADIARAYDDGPVSSEQILHPEKYWDAATRDDPTPLEITDVASILDDRWSRAYETDLGELQLALVVDPAPSLDVNSMVGAEAWTHPAAAGWDGDLWQLWQAGGRSLAIGLTVWDSDADAREFAAAVEGRDGWNVRRAGDRVGVVVGAKGRRARRLLEALLPVVEGPQSR